MKFFSLEMSDMSAGQFTQIALESELRRAAEDYVASPSGIKDAWGRSVGRMLVNERNQK